MWIFTILSGTHFSNVIWYSKSISTEDDAVLSVDTGPNLLNPVETFPVGEKDPYCI